MVLRVWMIHKQEEKKMEIKIELLGDTADKEMKNLLMMLLEGQKIEKRKVLEVKAPDELVRYGSKKK